MPYVSSCTGAVDRALSAEKGIISVHISLLQNTMKVVYNPSIISVRLIVATVEELGYEAIEWETHIARVSLLPADHLERKIRLEVSGMTCP